MSRAANTVMIVTGSPARIDVARSSELLTVCLKVLFPPRTSAISAIDMMATWLYYCAIWPLRARYIDSLTIGNESILGLPTIWTLILQAT
jgi:hypothetical protein